MKDEEDEFSRRKRFRRWVVVRGRLSSATRSQAYHLLRCFSDTGIEPSTFAFKLVELWISAAGMVTCLDKEHVTGVDNRTTSWHLQSYWRGPLGPRMYIREQSLATPRSTLPVFVSLRYMTLLPSNGCLNQATHWIESLHDICRYQTCRAVSCHRHVVTSWHGYRFFFRLWSCIQVTAQFLCWTP